MNARQGKCFNLLLTANAVLLTLFFVVQLVDGPPFAQQATAGASSSASTDSDMLQETAPIAAAPKRLTDEELAWRLERLAEAVERNSAMLRDGQASVRINNLDELTTRTAAGSDE